MDDLRECPFCGSTNVQVRGAFARYVICRDCEAATGLYDNREDAVKAWNRRSTDAKPL